MNGEVLYKETMAGASANSLAAIVIGRYRPGAAGPPNIIAVTPNGDVHGYLPEATASQAVVDKSALMMKKSKLLTALIII